MSQTLNLDKRQRAMLREMGVRVWQPMAPAAFVSPPALVQSEVVLGSAANSTTNSATSATNGSATGFAIDSIATSLRVSSSKGILKPQTVALQPTLPPLPPPAEVRSDSDAVSWSVGQALALYAQTAQATPAPGPRWLVLAETPAAALQPETSGSDTPFNPSFNPFEGDAGKLLDNMLRAVRLHQSGSAMLAPLVRRVGVESTPDTDLPAALASMVQVVQPDVLLVMGRLAAQALLQSSEPFGKLRGHVHTLHGVPTIVTQDAAYLLRSPLEKARAWEDLCLALSVL